MRTGKNDKEVDIVIEQSELKNILIEVKYRNGAPVSNESAIIENSSKAKEAIIVTKNLTEFGVHNAPNGNKLLRIPAFAYTFLLGYLKKH